MNLQDVKTPATRLKKARRIGRGQASGRGTTAGRGNKGQGSRSGSGGKAGFEGGQMPLARRLPKRGFTNALFKVTYGIVNVDELARAFEAGDEVTLATVKAKNLVKHKTERVKILGKGELDKALTVKVDSISETARSKVESAGGSVEIVQSTTKVKKSQADTAAPGSDDATS